MTLDRKKIETGALAWQYVNDHKLIPGFIRNLQRGKKVFNKKTGTWEVLYPPIKISNWMWFLEWHKDGYPHWHLFIEVEKAGKAGMIGGDHIRHYWDIGRVRESYIRDKKHWNFLTGYFLKHGYFYHKKGKDHQTKLPKWALNDIHLKIRRTGRKAKARAEHSELKVIPPKPQLIDPITGEIFTPKRRVKQTAYKVLFKKCGSQTRVTISNGRMVFIGTTNIPYKEIRDTVTGAYQEKLGYTFNASNKLLDIIIKNLVRVEYYNGDLGKIGQRLNRWEYYRMRQGEDAYKCVYG
ncbi:MAG: hypothetical protein K8R45_12010 [Desulfobacterales bacterium]|nr:hypothetical protein [Desulfobacterales bacterium]